MHGLGVPEVLKKYVISEIQRKEFQDALDEFCRRKQNPRRRKQNPKRKIKIKMEPVVGGAKLKRKRPQAVLPIILPPEEVVGPPMRIASDGAIGEKKHA